MRDLQEVAATVAGIDASSPDALRAQLSTGRVHHAQVFHGPAGVGKFTTAVAFAQQLLCHDPVTDLHGRQSACDACASCKLLHDSDEDDTPDTGGTASVTAIPKTKPRKKPDADGGELEPEPTG